MGGVLSKLSFSCCSLSSTVRVGFLLDTEVLLAVRLVADVEEPLLVTLELEVLDWWSQMSDSQTSTNFFTVETSLL